MTSQPKVAQLKSKVGRINLIKIITMLSEIWRKQI